MQVRSQALMFTAGIAACATCLPVSITAQSPTPQECSTIVANALSHPANLDTLAMIVQCPGVTGSVFATLLNEPAVFADSSTYDTVFRWASYRREPEVFAVALADFADEGELRLRRMVGAAILVKYLAPSSPDWKLREFPQNPAAIDGCAVGPGTSSWAGDLPLPASAIADAKAAAVSVIGGSGPASVRFLAHCVLNVTAPDSGMFDPGLPLNEEFNPASDFEFDVLCGRRVLLRNKSLAPVSIRLVWGDDYSQILQNTQARDYTLEGRTPPATSFETVWQVPSPTALKFRIQEVTNGWGGPPYILLVNVETLNTTSCP